MGRLDAQVAEIQAVIPNMSHPDAPVGADDKANLEIRRGATNIRELDFQPLDHVELCEKLDLLDLEGGARTTGHSANNPSRAICCASHLSAI